MFDNIFDLFNAMGLPDPRKDPKFKEYLKQLLDEIDNPGQQGQQDSNTEDILARFESLSTIQEKLSFIKSLLSNAHNQFNINLIIEIYKKYNIDLDYIRSASLSELSKLSELPKIGEHTTSKIVQSSNSIDSDFSVEEYIKMANKILKYVGE